MADTKYLREASAFRSRPLMFSLPRINSAKHVISSVDRRRLFTKSTVFSLQRRYECLLNFYLPGGFEKVITEFGVPVECHRQGSKGPEHRSR